MSATPPTAEKSENSQAPVVAADNTAAPALPRVSIFNLPQGITSKDDLLTLCRSYGQVVDAEFFAARNQKQAFGFVTFKTREDAEFAIYRLDRTTLGGKTPVKAMLAQDRPKREGFVPGQQQQKKPKVKKPITPLTVLTPKNLASPAPPQQDPLNGKAGWDLNKPVQNIAQGQGQQKNPRKNNQQVTNGQQPQSPQPGTQKNNQGQGKPVKAPQQGNTTPAPAQVSQQQAVNPQNAGQNQGAAQNGGQNQGAAQNQNQQGGSKKNPNNNKRGANPNKAVSQQAQGSGNASPQPPQNQQRTQPAQVNQPAAPAQQANQNQPSQNQQGAAQNQPNQNQQGKAAKKRKNKKNPETQIRYRVNVVDSKNNLALHVVELNQGQYDKFILPLVTVNK